MSSSLRRIGIDGIGETINGLRRRGFGRLLVDGKAVTFDDVDLSTLQTGRRSKWWSTACVSRATCGPA